MRRRELLRVMSAAGTLAATAPSGGTDGARPTQAADGTNRLDLGTLRAYQALNAHLWRVFVLSRAKSTVLPVVREQIDLLMEWLRRSHRTDVHRGLCEVASDLFQLTGEIFFDGRNYTEASYCYTLAASAAKEAEANDLWACAVTRHAFVSLHERQFTQASDMLGLAARLADGGDHALSTRHWIGTVEAVAFAAKGDADACRKALDRAEGVRLLSGEVQNGGWLRFDGSRLPEERGACMVMLKRPDLAEPALTEALQLASSLRRRGAVLTGLAAVGLQRKDLDQALLPAEEALGLARSSGSGYVRHALQELRPELAPFVAHARVRRIIREIEELVENDMT